MICLPVLALSCWFWLSKFQTSEMGEELPATTSRHRHICNPCRVRQKKLPSGLICGSSMQQYSFPWLVSSKTIRTVFSYIINLTPPNAVLHHEKMARSGERCLSRGLCTLYLFSQTLDRTTVWLCVHWWNAWWFECGSSISMNVICFTW